MPQTPLISLPKMCVNKEIVLIYYDPLPPPPNEEMKNMEIFVSFLTPSLLPKIRKSAKPNFAFIYHNQSGYIQNPRQFSKGTKTDRKKDFFENYFFSLAINKIGRLKKPQCFCVCHKR